VARTYYFGHHSNPGKRLNLRQDRIRPISASQPSMVSACLSDAFGQQHGIVGRFLFFRFPMFSFFMSAVASYSVMSSPNSIKSSISFFVIGQFNFSVVARFHKYSIRLLAAHEMHNFGWSIVYSIFLVEFIFFPGANALYVFVEIVGTNGIEFFVKFSPNSSGSMATSFSSGSSSQTVKL